MTARKLEASFPMESPPQAGWDGSSQGSNRLPVSVLVLQLRLCALELLQRSMATE
ncbi:hypothetical protein [Rhodopirellula baltica]|uniref:hypothetical protein n=1 Tax=Rhodopirellula baltica TaxID=265606 RepID=UPI001360B407|nr:hypothetical protein [Rhodopirellula baltica]